MLLVFEYVYCLFDTLGLRSLGFASYGGVLIGGAGAYQMVFLEIDFTADVSCTFVEVSHTV